MSIAVFGAGGRTGRRLVAGALARGDGVHALVRRAGTLPPHVSLRESVGDARDAGDVAATLGGTDAVFCCLGLADITRPTTEFSDAVRAIVDAMRANGPRRIVAIASAGALPDADGGLRMDRHPGGPYRHINAEHARNYATLRDSGLDWTLVCAIDLVDDIPAGHARIAIEDLPPGDVTGYEDLAATMLALAGDRASFGKRVGIVSVR
jgi:putative NADH-flavin reductase